jgi:hypothetical protein
MASDRSVWGKKKQGGRRQVSIVVTSREEAERYIERNKEWWATAEGRMVDELLNRDLLNRDEGGLCQDDLFTSLFTCKRHAQRKP